MLLLLLKQKCIILNEGKYSEFKKSNKKPSEFCKSVLGFKTVKTSLFVENYFSNINSLISTIQEYKRISLVRKGEYTLSDLLK